MNTASTFLAAAPLLPQVCLKIQFPDGCTEEKVFGRAHRVGDCFFDLDTEAKVVTVYEVLDVKGNWEKVRYLEGVKAAAWVAARTILRGFSLSKCNTVDVA